jgi:hypothetical protein
MPYLEACLKEAMRLYPPGVFTMRQPLAEDFSIKGVTIPRGTWIHVRACAPPCLLFLFDFIIKGYSLQSASMRRPPGCSPAAVGRRQHAPAADGMQRSVVLTGLATSSFECMLFERFACIPPGSDQLLHVALACCMEHAGWIKSLQWIIEGWQELI